MRIAATFSALGLFFALTACGKPTAAGFTDITGVMPPLAFHMTRVNDSAWVSAKKYHGKVVVLYFGYTHCPDECPTTLANMASVLQKLGARARDLRVLFVSVDPLRDVPSVLKSYVQAFAPEIDGLRGSADDVASLARRYRVIYSVTPATSQHPYQVSHSASVFFFDPAGHARFVTTSTENTSDIVARILQLDRNP